eukprot:jgi/Bigna1/78980/fgenesh1_pg.58_\
MGSSTLLGRFVLRILLVAAALPQLAVSIKILPRTNLTGSNDKAGSLALLGWEGCIGQEFWVSWVPFPQYQLKISSNCGNRGRNGGSMNVWSSIPVKPFLKAGIGHFAIEEIGMGSFKAIEDRNILRSINMSVETITPLASSSSSSSNISSVTMRGTLIFPPLTAAAALGEDLKIEDHAAISSIVVGYTFDLNTDDGDTLVGDHIGQDENTTSSLRGKTMMKRKQHLKFHFSVNDTTPT